MLFHQSFNLIEALAARLKLLEQIVPIEECAPPGAENCPLGGIVSAVRGNPACHPVAVCYVVPSEFPLRVGPLPELLPVWCQSSV